MNTKIVNRALVVLVVLAVGLGVLHLVTGHHDRTATAYFTSTEGIYPGDEVRVLGVPVGKITHIEATDHGVKVTFDYDEDVKLPADAKAVIVAPSLVSSRYLQLTPQYSSGAVLSQGAVIPESRTVVPVEFDQIKQQLDGIATTFGPNDLNKTGSVSKVITSGSRALKGEGQNINDTLAQLSGAVSVLDRGAPDLFGTIKNLQVFIKALSGSDRAIRTFDQRLDVVGGILARNRTTLTQGLRQLDGAVKDVDGFVEHNRSSLLSTLPQLTKVLQILNGQKSSIEEILHIGPNALHNLLGAFDPKANSLAVGLLTANTTDLRQFVCGALGSTGVPGSAIAVKTCADLLGPLLDALSLNLPISTAQLTQLEMILFGGVVP